MSCAEAAIAIDWQFNDNLFDEKPDLAPIAGMTAFTGAWTFNPSTGKLSVIQPSRRDAGDGYPEGGRRHNRRRPGFCAGFRGCLLSGEAVFRVTLLSGERGLFS